MFLTSMSGAIRLVGSTTLGIVSFNIPCIFYLKLSKEKMSSWRMILCMLVFLVASVVLIYSFVDFFI